MTRALVVEDEGIIAADLEMSLQDLGYDVIAICPSGEEAVRVAKEERPELVMMDIHLAGDMDGTEAARKIREHVDAAIVFLTAYADDETVKQAQRSGPFGYLVKPYETETLRTTLQTAMQLRDRQRVDERERQSLQAEATRLGVETDRMQDEAKALHRALDHIESPTIVLRDGIVLAANEPAQALAGGPDGMPWERWPFRDEQGRTGAMAWDAAQTGSTWTLGSRSFQITVDGATATKVIVLAHSAAASKAAQGLVARARDLI